MAQMARTRLAQLLRPEHVTLWLELALKSIEIEINRINRVIFFSPFNRFSLLQRVSRSHASSLLFLPHFFTEFN